jgi:hypothetical protein
MSRFPISEASSIRVAEYLTEFPPREVLEQKLEGSDGDSWELLGEGEK